MADDASDLPAAGVDDVNRFDLREAFLRRQEQLLATLGVGRSVGSHPVAVGDDSELNWRGMLQSILPSRYQVSKGFAVDSAGRRSDQIDVLIYDHHFSPVLLDVGDHLYIPVESVFAALEVKQDMSRATIEYASEKVGTVRALTRTSAPVPYVEGKYAPKQPHPIIGGLLTAGTEWTPPMGEPLEKALRDFSDHGGLDIGCALDGGSFDVLADRTLIKSEKASALIFFILRLLRRLQQMGSPPAMDYDTYDAVLGPT